MTSDDLNRDPQALARAQRSMGPFSDYLGLELLGFSTSRVVARWPVRPELHQPFGLVHGGAFATVVETLPSFGAYLFAVQRGGTVVGVNNNTDLLRSASDGVLDAVAVAVHQGRLQQLWTVEISLPDGRLAARGALRLQNLYPDPEHAQPVGG